MIFLIDTGMGIWGSNALSIQCCNDGWSCTLPIIFKSMQNPTSNLTSTQVKQTSICCQDATAQETSCWIGKFGGPLETQINKISWCGQNNNITVAHPAERRELHLRWISKKIWILYNGTATSWIWQNNRALFLNTLYDPPWARKNHVKSARRGKSEKKNDNIAALCLCVKYVSHLLKLVRLYSI